MSFKKVMRIVGGGKTRQESVRKGLESINEDEGKVLIHDAVRPFISTMKIEEVIDLLNDYNAVSLALPVKETIGIAGEGGVLIDIPDRKKLFSLQTPQGFKLSLIRCAHAKALEENFREATDDCSLVKRYFPENPIFLAPGEEKNIKITYSMDLKVAEAMLSFSEKGLEK